MIYFNHLIISIICSVGLYLFFGNAFNTVDKTILLDTLDHYGVGVKCDLLIRSYLSDRVLFVYCNSTKSHAIPVSVSVPLGSV